MNMAVIKECSTSFSTARLTVFVSFCVEVLKLDEDVLLLVPSKKGDLADMLEYFARVFLVALSRVLLLELASEPVLTDLCIEEALLSGATLGLCIQKLLRLEAADAIRLGADDLASLSSGCNLESPFTGRSSESPSCPRKSKFLPLLLLDWMLMLYSLQERGFFQDMPRVEWHLDLSDATLEEQLPWCCSKY